ncbi:hypothetical protein [Aggregatilinea lenta]|uniref:hypothetical protein n=1 Tax=Aggregatilinea lenta TaxID=913108 RepID=UPI000E5B4A73|nr:hypothetical protein [Aggregatilinea lenta]
MYPEDRVLVGVIKRKRDLDLLQQQHWYRVPQGRAPKGIYAEYVAFFLSRAFKDLNGGIHYYARRTGVELARRRDLLPDEASHPRADAVYYKLQLAEIRRKDPPVLNEKSRAISFVYTTWDRFSAARVIDDLYSEADFYVDRVYHALERRGVRSEQVWEASRSSDDGGAQIHVKCARGTIIATTGSPEEHRIPLPVSSGEKGIRASVDTILAAIRAHGGPLMANLPIEG